VLIELVYPSDVRTHYGCELISVAVLRWSIGRLDLLRSSKFCSIFIQSP
jgi:hypothetical protein